MKSSDCAIRGKPLIFWNTLKIGKSVNISKPHLIMNSRFLAVKIRKSRVYYFRKLFVRLHYNQKSEHTSGKWNQIEAQEKLSGDK